MSARARASRVTAEFAIVVVGVLAALAVDQWREDRRDRELASFYLAALEDDLRADSAEITRVMLQAEAVQASAARLEAVTAAPSAPEHELSLLIDVGWLLMRLAYSPSSAAFEDMKSSGNLRVIANPELRNRLQRYSANIARSAQAIIDDGVGVARRDFPAELVQSPVMMGLLERVESAESDEDLWPGLVDPADVAALIRDHPEAMREWLRRRQLHAAFVRGETRFRLTNQTLPMLADIRNERAGRALALRE